ncbi:hypothetical protein JCM10213_003791, partial [Rhodosporidiobolus nylandii]
RVLTHVEYARSLPRTHAQIDPHKRHVDRSTVAEFWRQLEGWIAMNKPWLSY